METTERIAQLEAEVEKWKRLARKHEHQKKALTRAVIRESDISDALARKVIEFASLIEEGDRGR